jgi:hypothetical protein
MALVILYFRRSPATPPDDIKIEPVIIPPGYMTKEQSVIHNVRIPDYRQSNIVENRQSNIVENRQSNIVENRQEPIIEQHIQEQSLIQDDFNQKSLIQDDYNQQSLIQIR